MMKTGKISETILKRSVLNSCSRPAGRLLQGAGPGLDGALCLTEGSVCVSAAVHPAVIDTTEKIRYALEHAANNVACSGCMPEEALLTLLLPEGTEESALKDLMRTAKRECGRLHLQIAGGHTEVSPSVRLPVLHVTALGFLPKADVSVGTAAKDPAKPWPGMDLFIVNWIGMEGTSLLVNAHKKELLERFPADFVEQARRLGEHICIAQEALRARKLGAAALHDLSQGGVFGALWEFCERAGCGMEADLRKIPIKQETVEVCEFLGRNPYCLLSGGAFLAAAEKGEELAKALRAENIPAAVIGRLTDLNGRILLNGEERRFLDRPAQDEIWKER